MASVRGNITILTNLRNNSSLVVLFIALVTLVFSGCSETQTKGSARFEALLGNNQVLAPREASKQAIEFVMSDATGLPVPGVKVEIRLFVIEDTAANPTSEMLKTMWDTASAAPDASNPSILAEKVGRVDGSRFVTTDRSGRVSVNIIAPSRFSARTVVAVRTLQGQSAPDLIAFALVSTSSTEDAGNLTLESNFENNIVPAGKNVDFWVVIRDQTGSIVTAFEGPAVFKVEAQKPTISWAGLSSVAFDSEISCNFVAGRCAVSGGPFNFASSEELKIAIQGLKPATTRFETKIVIQKGASPAQVIATDRLGGPDAKASPLRDVALNAGQSVELGAAWIDEGGNYLGDATDTRWLSSSALFQNFLPADARGSFSFKPTRSGVFELKMSSASARQSSTLPVEVRAGMLAGWKIESQHNGIEVAGSCFRVSVTAIDDAGNTIPNIEGQIIGRLEIGGVSETPPLVYDIAHFNRLGIRLTNEVAARVNFQFGTSTPTEQACLFDATNVSPKIVFTANGFTGELPITVLKGEAAVIRLSRQNTGDDAPNACTTPLTPDNIGSPCITFSADEMAFPTPVRAPMYAALTDIAGNYVANTNTRWQITGPLGELNSDGSAKYAQIGTLINEQRLDTRLAGKGTFLITPEGDAVSPQRFAYEIRHGAVKTAQVDTVESGRQLTTAPFKIKPSLFDKWSNLATSFTGTLSASVSMSHAPASPSGTPSKSTFAWSMNFSTGGGTLVSTDTLQLPCACNPDVQPSAGIGCRDQANNGYLVVVSDPDQQKTTYECPKVNLNIAGLGVFSSAPLSISPGPLSSIKLRDSAAGYGVELGEKAIVDPATSNRVIEQEIFKPLNIFFAGYDALGNYRSETSSDALWQWTTVGMAQSPAPSFQPRATNLSVVSTETGEGRITANAVADPTVSVSTPVIRFKSSKAIRYSIETSNTDPATGLSREKGGEPFDIRIRALDALGNMDPKFSGERTFTFVTSSLPSWAGQSPVLPDGDEYSCTFISGVCVLPRPSQSTNGWIVANARASSVMSLVETTPTTQLPTGGQKLSGTFATTILMTTGPAFRIVLADKAGGPAQSAKMLELSNSEIYRISTDETLSGYAALVDKGGNFFGELPSAELLKQGDATYILPYIAVTGNKIDFAPKLKTPRSDPSQPPTAVALGIASTNAQVLPFSINVSIYHGIPTKFDIRLLQENPSNAWTEAASQLVAGECYQIDVTLLDANSNEVDTLSGSALSKLGAKNFSVSSNVLNFNGGFYKKRANYQTDPVKFNSYFFSSSDPLFAGPEYAAPDRLGLNAYPRGRQMGGFTAFNQTSGGKVTNSDQLFFCQSDASNGSNRMLQPQITLQLVGGLSYKTKNDLQLPLAQLTGESSAYSVSAGPAAALLFYPKLMNDQGQETLAPPLCPIVPSTNFYVNQEGPAMRVELRNSNTNERTPRLFEDGGQPYCYALNADLGGLNLVAKVTDAAGNVLSQAAQGTWSLVSHSESRGCTPSLASPTLDSFKDSKRCAGSFSLEYTETTTGLKATIVTNVKSGRPHKLTLSASPTVVATSAFAPPLFNVADRWGNSGCTPRYGYDSLFGGSGVTVNFKTRWLGIQPSTPKVRVGATLASETSGSIHCWGRDRVFQVSSEWLQIPKSGTYILEIESNSLINTDGSAVPVAQTRQSGTITVYPGIVSSTQLEYAAASGGEPQVPTAAGTPFPLQVATPQVFPHVLKSFYLAYSSVSGGGISLALYSAGYDREDNFSAIVNSNLISVSAVEDESLAPMDSEFVALGCDQPSRVICSLSAQGNFKSKDKIHNIAGVRAGTSQLHINDAFGNSFILPEIRVVPGLGNQLVPTQVDDSKMRYADVNKSEALVGSEKSFKLRLADSNGNTLKDYSNSTNINFQFTREGAETTAENFKNIAPVSRAYAFSNGVTTESLLVKLYVAGNYWLRALSPIAAGSSSGSLIEFSTTDVVAADSFDHYGTIAQGPGPKGEYYPHRNLPSDRVFTTQIELRDQFGNVLLPDSGPKLPVALTLVREGGGPIGGALHGTTQSITLSATDKQTIITDLRYPQAGDFKIIASDSSGKTTPLIAASTIEMIPSLDVLNRYEIVRLGGLSGNYTMSAGQQYNFIVRAVDLYNQPITGIDNLLSAFSFQWSGANPARDSAQTSPQWSSQLSFSNGAASATIAFYRAEVISNGSFEVRDNRAVNEQQSGSYAGITTVEPGAISEYELLTCINATNCNTATKSRKAEKSADGLFDVSIATFDAWKNPRRGEAGVRLVAQKVDPTNAGPNVSSFLSSSGPNADTAFETTTVNLTSSTGSLTLPNLYYPVGHQVELDLAGTSVGVAIKPKIQFEYTANSIDKYKLTFSSNNLTAGPNNLTLTAEAVDKAQNTITGLDSILNARLLRISGTNSAPNGQFPSLTNGENATQPQSWNFTNGAASQSLSLYRAESLPIGGFILSDNSGVSGANTSALIISEGNVSVIGYRVPSGTMNNIPTQVAGNDFSLEVSTTDAYGNPSDKSCGSGIQVGQGQTSPGGWGGTAEPANIPSPIYASKGFYRLQNIRLIKAGTESLSFTACASPQTSIAIGVSPAAVNRMVLKDTASVPTTDELGLTGSANLGEVACTNPTAGSSQTSCGSVHAFFWDSFGNRIDPANNSCQWAWNNANAQHGLTINSPPNLAGSGGSRSISSSDFVDGTLSCTRESVTKSVKFWGGVAKVDAAATFVSSGVNITTSNVPAGTQLTVSGIRLWTSKDGGLVGLPPSETNSSKRLDFSGTLAIAELPSTVNCALNSSQCGNSYVGYLRTSGSAGSISLQVHGKSISWNELTVDPGPATQIDVAQVPSNATVGIALANVKVIMKDQFGNATNTYTNNGQLAQCSTIGVTFGSGLNSSGRNGTTTAEPSANPPTPLVGTNRGEYTSTLTLYKTGPNSVTFAGCGMSNARVISVIPNIAHVGYLSTLSTDTSVNTATTAFDCQNNNDSPTTTAVTCSQINAYYWDAWGNSLNGGNPVSCSWTYTNAPPQGGLSAAAIPNTTPNGGSWNISATDFVDGNLACVNGSITAQSKVYGGVSKFEVTSPTPAAISNSTIVANDNNVSFAGIQLYQRRNGLDVVKPASANTTFKINIDTSTSTNTFTDIVASGESGRDATNQIITRTFNTTGLSTSGLALSYKKAPTSNTNNLTLRLQGKTTSYTSMTIAPNNANKYKFPTVASQTAGSAFGFDVEILDAFDNRTNKNNSGALCASSAITLSGSGQSPGNSSTSTGTQTSPDFSQATGTAAMSATAGVYSLGNVKLYRAGGESLTVQACGLSAQSFPVTVVAAAANAGVLRTTSVLSSTNETETICPMHGTNNQINCSGNSVFAYFWDQYGNELKSEAAKCDSWSFNNQGRADAVSVASAAAANVTLTNKTPAQTWVDGTLSCSKSPLASPLTQTVWGGVKEVRITAQNSSSSDITSSSPTLTAASGNLKIAAVNLRTTKAGVDTASPIDTSRSLTWNTTATIVGWGVGGSGSSTQIGQVQNITPTFTAGAHTTSYAFNFIKAESNKTISATVYGLNSNAVSFSVQPANASSIVLNKFNGSAANAFPALTAGTSFGFEAEVRDQFANRTTTSATSSDCSAGSLTVDLPSGQTKDSLGETSTSLGSVSTFSALSFAPASGVYTATGVALFNATNTTVQLSACGVNQNFTVSVAPAVVANVAVNTSSTTSATNITELTCDNSGTSNTVKCSSVYAYFWDQYGNQRATDTCNSWSYSDNSGASITPVYSAGTVASQTNLTHATAKFIDGSLGCNNSRSGFTTSPSIRLWGGVKTVSITVTDISSNNITSTTSTSPANLTAAIGNARVNQISLQTTKAGNTVASPFNTGATINWSVAGASEGSAWNNTTTTGTNTQISASSQTPLLSFSNGVHTASPAVSFNFVKPGASNLSASVYGVQSNIVYLNVDAAAANSVTISSAPSPNPVTAGATFDLGLNVTDVFGNLTSTHSAGTASCGAVTITGPASSPSTGPAGTTSTPAVLNPTSAAAPASTGVYTITGLQIFNAGTSQALNISACGLNISSASSITVKSATPTVATLTKQNTRATAPSDELFCSNSASSPFAVSCSGQTAYAWFWDMYGNTITSGNASTTNDDKCPSWSFTAASDAPTTFAASGGANSLSSSINVSSGSPSFIDGTLSCKNGGTALASIPVWGGVKTVAITASNASDADITNSNPSLTAGTGNFKVNSISLKTTKAGAPVASQLSGSVSVTWNTSATAAGGWGTGGEGTSTKFGQAETNNLTFASGAHNTTYAFNIVKAESGKEFRANVFGVDSNAVQFSIAPATAATLTLAATPTTITAGQSVNLTVSAKDAFQNPTFEGCDTATLGAVGDLNSPSGAAPVFSPATPLGKSGTTGTFNTATVTLKKASGGQVISANACGKSAESAAINVNSHDLSNILLSTSNAQPIYNTTLSTSADLACTVGSTVNCPQIYAFGEDTYGNAKGAVVCGTWTYAADSSLAPTLSHTSGASTVVSNATNHIDGTLTCTISSLTRSVPLFGKIQKTPSITCGAWACSNTTPVSNCTVTNNSGYDISSFAFAAGSPTPNVNNCNAALASGNNCSMVFNGTTGQSLASATLQSTPQEPSVVIFNSVTSSVGNANNAPNCSQTLQAVTGSWSCTIRNENGIDVSRNELTISYTNPNGVDTFNVASGSPSLTTANGASIIQNTCGSSIAPNNSCSVVIRGTMTDSTSTLELAPTNGSSFGTSSITTSTAPSCP